MAASFSHAKLVLPSKAFDARRALAEMSAQRATVVVATAEQAAELAAAAVEDAAASKPLYDLSSLRGGLVVSASGAATTAAIGGAKLRAVAEAALPALR